MRRRRARLSAMFAVLIAVLVAMPQDDAAALVVARVPIALGFIQTDEVDAGGAVWSLSLDGEAGYLYKIDPATNAILAEVTLPPGNPTGDSLYVGGMVAAYGALWVADTWRDRVLRLDPDTGTIQRRIPTGRTPTHVTAGGGSIWTSNSNNQSVTRIDPGSNTAVATIPIGRRPNGTDGPFSLAWDPYADRLLVTMPGSDRVAAVEPGTQRTTYVHIAPAVGCGRPVPVPGGFWLDDTLCSNDIYRWDDRQARITAHVTVDGVTHTGIYGAVSAGAVFYTGEYRCNPRNCSHGDVVKRDSVTGDVLATRHVGNRAATLPAIAGGDLWLSDTYGTLVRVRIF